MIGDRPVRRIAIVQSNYIPWKGYFDLIGLADEFVIYDEVQYTTNDWRNRNRIKTANGLQWLTIPVVHSGRFGQRIDEAVTAGSLWRKKHWRAISQAYSSAPYFETYREPFADLYAETEETLLSSINYTFITEICRALGISTRITWSTEYPGGRDRVGRLVCMCEALRATHYLSGPAAKDYLDEERFASAGIEVEYMRYDNYPPYPQRHGPFAHAVSALDLVFNEGPNAATFMKFGLRASTSVG